MKHASAQRGFTLIELLIVVAIIGVLAAIAIPQYQNYVDRSSASAAQSEAAGFRTSVEAVLLDGDDPAQETVISTPDSLTIEEDDGAYTIVSERTVRGDSQTVTYTRDKDGQWTCEHTFEGVNLQNCDEED